MTSTNTTRIAITLDTEILEELDRTRDERTRSNYINDLLFYSLATEENMGIRNISEK
jgi:metal-responsive CopG/Arc/MetJ family transcriptional regulator